MKRDKPLLAMKGLSKPGTGENIRMSLTGIFVGGLFVAITIVCFLGPVLEMLYEWLDESIVHSLIMYGIFTGMLGFVLLVVKLYKK